MYYVGLDVHWRTSTMCILDDNGKEVKTVTLRGGWERLLGELAKLPRPWTVCFEASCGYGHLYDRLASMAHRVVVAHPGHLRLIFRAKRKNDRIDARKIAKLLLLDEVPTAHVPDQRVRSWRQLIEYRRRLIDKRVRCKNGLRSLLRSFGIRGPRSLWTAKGRLWLGQVTLPTPMAILQRDMLLEELVQFDAQVKRVTVELDRIAARHAGVRMLQSIPGVGPRTAEAMVAYVDDPARFARTRQVGSYFGMVPCQDASAGVNRLGHITRSGPATVRKLVVEATWQVIRRSATAKARFTRIAQDRPDRRKVALVATSHWLIRCMAAMLRSGELWRETA